MLWLVWILAGIGVLTVLAFGIGVGLVIADRLWPIPSVYEGEE